MPSAPIVYRTTAPVVLPRNRVITDISAFYGITNADVIAVGNDVKAGELYNVMSTLVGDEPGLPTFGCNLPRRVFDPIVGSFAQELFTDVYTAGQVWCPDIPILVGQCSVVALPGARLGGVTIAYQFSGDTWVLPIHLTELGNQ